MVGVMRNEIGTRDLLPMVSSIAEHYLLKIWKELRSIPASVLGYEMARR